MAQNPTFFLQTFTLALVSREFVRVMHIRTEYNFLQCSELVSV